MGEEATGHALVDDGDLRRILRVPSGEGASCKERNSHGGEKSVANDVEEHLIGVLGDSRNALEENKVAPSTLIECIKSEASRLDAGNRLDAGLDLLLKVDGADLVR